MVEDGVGDSVHEALSTALAVRGSGEPHRKTDLGVAVVEPRATIMDYTVQRRANGSSTWTTVADGVSTARRATVRGLTNRWRFYFRVAARNRAGLGPWSSRVSAIPFTKPSAPTSLIATRGDGVVRVAWSTPSSNGGAPITDYTVQRSRNGTTWATVADGVATIRRVMVTGPPTEPATTSVLRPRTEREGATGRQPLRRSR